MTEWKGIKVGGLYKRTGRGSRGAPMAMVVSIEGLTKCADEFDTVKLVTLEEGKLHTTWLREAWRCYGEFEVDGEKWPWKAVQ